MKDPRQGLLPEVLALGILALIASLCAFLAGVAVGKM